MEFSLQILFLPSLCLLFNLIRRERKSSLSFFSLSLIFFFLFSSYSINFNFSHAFLPIINHKSFLCKMEVLDEIESVGTVDSTPRVGMEFDTLDEDRKSTRLNSSHAQ